MLLKIMNDKWSELGIEELFKYVHHFSANQISNIPSTLSTFVKYCDGKRLEGQNARTIERALEVARYIKQGINPKAAIQIAWDSYPLVNS